MEHRTIGDNLAEAIAELEHAVENDGYDALEPCDQAYLHEALHFLTLVENGSN